MKVMKRAVIEYRDMRPLPASVGGGDGGGFNHVTLPVKIEAARRAIAECVDLPELLRYRDQAEGLAAAVRTMKHVGPEMIRAANEMMADAWRKGGQLLSAYSNVAPQSLEKGTMIQAGCKGRAPSPRRVIAESLGIPFVEATAMVRVAAAPKSAAYKAISRHSSVRSVASKLPALPGGNPAGGKSYSNALRDVLSDTSHGIVVALSVLRRTPLHMFPQLTPDERKVVKAKITDCMELLDEMDRLCK